MKLPDNIAEQMINMLIMDQVDEDAAERLVKSLRDMIETGETVKTPKFQLSIPV